MRVTPGRPSGSSFPGGPISTVTAIETSDDALVRRAVAGDLRAFEDLVRRHRDPVYRLAARIVGAHRADDVAQDAFLRAFHRLRQFRGDSSFRAWVLRITHNAALTLLARERPSSAAHPDDEAGTHADERAPRTPAEQLEVRERRERLLAKLLEIAPAHRAVLVLRDLEGLSYREIAEVTDSPLGTVKGRLHRARQELIELLRRNAYDWELPA